MEAHISHLSAPKGVKYECELTGEPATIQTEINGVTYFYASREHQDVDFRGIMQKIGPIMAPLKEAEAARTGTHEEREERKKHLQSTRKALIDICRSEASKFLVVGEFELAIPGALRFLRFSQKVFGENSVRVVPAYLLLAEAQLGLGRTQQAEEFLSMARWNVQQNPDCGNELRATLYRNFGKLCKAQGKGDEALRHFGEDVYYSSLEMGPEHPDTARGYFHMATIFYMKREVEHALALFDKVVDCWYKYLLGTGDEGMGMGEAQLQEARGMLQFVADRREKFLGERHIATGEVQYTLALLLIGMNSDHQTSLEYVKNALGIYKEQLGEDHPSTRDVQTTHDHLAATIPVPVTESERGAGGGSSAGGGAGGGGVEVEA